MFIVKLSDQPIYTIVAILEYERRGLGSRTKEYSNQCNKIARAKELADPILKAKRAAKRRQTVSLWKMRKND